MLTQAQPLGKVVRSVTDPRRKTVGRAGNRCSTLSQQSSKQDDQDTINISTRRTLLLAVVTGAAFTLAPSSTASDNGLLEFLKSRQRANGGEKLLAPIRSARLRLEAARTLLQAADNPSEYKTVLSLVRSASFNCYIFDSFSDDSLETKASLLQQQLQIGDPCTFRIISRNVTNLLDTSEEELIAQTTHDLENLIRAFQLLDDMIDRVRLGEAEATKMAEDTLNLTIQRTVAFEEDIKKCLGLTLV